MAKLASKLGPDYRDDQPCPPERGASELANERRRKTMQRTLLKSKIHRATVTDCDLNYVGSLTVDATLLDLANIGEYEQVHVVNVNNGARFLTYAMAGDPGSGQIQVNGAAARLAHYGDIIIVFSYAQYDEAEVPGFQPIVITVDEANNPVPLEVAQATSSPDRAP